jgi:hypothetical protein
MRNFAACAAILGLAVGLAAGCAAFDPALARAAVKRGDLTGEPVDALVAISTAGQATYPVSRAATSGELASTFAQLQTARTVTPATTTVEIPVRQTLAHALATGGKYVFRRQVSVGTEAWQASEAEFMLQVTVAAARGRQEMMSRSTVEYKAAVFDRSGKSLAGLSGEALGTFLSSSVDRYFMGARSACGYACRQAAIQILPWAAGVMREHRQAPPAER